MNKERSESRGMELFVHTINYSRVDAICNHVIKALKSSSAPIVDIWKYVGMEGVFSLNRAESVYLTKELIRLGVFEFPFWLQSDVIQQIINSIPKSDYQTHLISELLNGKKLFALALTETDGGSSFQNITSQVLLDSQKILRLSGHKLYITNGNFFDIAFVMARDSEGKLGLYTVKHDRTVLVNKLSLCDAMGAFAMGEITFTESPCVNLYEGKPEDCAFNVNKALSIERLFCSICMIEIAKYLLVDLREWLKKRKVNASNSQYIRFALASIKANLCVAEIYIEKQVNNYIGQKAILPHEAAIAKLTASQLLHQAVDTACGLYGAEALLSNSNVQRLQAYCAAFSSAGGTNEIMKEIVSTSI